MGVLLMSTSDIQTHMTFWSSTQTIVTDPSLQARIAKTFILILSYQTFKMCFMHLPGFKVPMRQVLPNKIELA
jgi:hypothetical protein